MEARKIAKQNWTTTTIRATDERMQALVKNASLHQSSQPRLELEAMAIAKQNTLVARAKWTEKKIN